LTIFIGLPCVIWVAYLVSVWKCHNGLPGALFGIPFWMLTFWLYCSIRCMMFKCPRCSQLFFLRYGLFDPTLNHCGHCGLRKYAPYAIDR
jgi:hypothetical protein